MRKQKVLNTVHIFRRTLSNMRLFWTFSYFFYFLEIFCERLLVPLVGFVFFQCEIVQLLEVHEDRAFSNWVNVRFGRKTTHGDSWNVWNGARMLKYWQRESKWEIAFYFFFNVLTKMRWMWFLTIKRWFKYAVEPWKSDLRSLAPLR